MRLNHSTFSHRLGLFVATGSTILAASLAPRVALAGFPPATSSTSHASCPSDMALVGSTCVDKFEGSLVETHADGSESTFSPYAAPNGHAVRAVSREGVVPQAHISMVEAQRACKASGKRLCHAREWKNACEGPSKTRYPYGQTHVENACVDSGRTSPMAVLHNGEHSAKTMNDPQANQLENTLESTGAAAACTNDYGVHDMVGNIHEWADDGAFHGGYYLDTKLNGPGCNYATTAHAKTYYDYSTGFRCCADEGTLPDDAITQEAPAPSTHDTEESAPRPRPFAHGAPGSNTDDDDAPTANPMHDAADGDRKSLEPFEIDFTKGAVR